MTRFEQTSLALALVAAVAVPLLLDTYLVRVAATALYFVVLASSWNLLLGYAGVLSFAHAAFAAVGAYTSGLLCRYTGLPPVLGVLLGGLVAPLVGWALARMCLRLRGPYLALMTIGFSEAEASIQVLSAVPCLDLLPPISSAGRRWAIGGLP